ncbi:MAG TPA: hypothetical protein PLF31_01345 [Candidatus Paceibacterota bacterium]|nr:hypothetical protein [Candidatus Paceibacterota bacterium]
MPSATIHRTYSFGRLVQVLHDAPRTDNPERDRDILEVYFTDLYKLLLVKLAKFESSPEFSKVDTDKMQHLLSEIINVKCLLSKCTVE